MIPKILHRIWIGPPMPALCRSCSQSWLRLHPKWDHRLWSEEDLRELGSAALNNMMDSPNTNIDAAMISDYARLLILFKFGGLYVDADVRPVRSFDALMDISEVALGALHPRLGGPRRRPDPNVLFAPKEAPMIGSLLDKCAMKRGGEIGIMLEKAGAKIFPYQYFHDMTHTDDTYSLHWGHRLGSWLRK